MAKLLLLDDDEATLTWMRAALESRGHDVSTYTTARAALGALEAADRPDLIVADLLLPEVDGLAFARLVRRHGKTPLMFVSIAKKQAEAVLAGAIGYVQKPASAMEVRMAVERLLGEGARRNSILVVDDAADVRTLYRALLEPRFVVLTAENGKEALAVLRTMRVDLAIVDVHMPVMNGAELVRAMRNDPVLEGLPVIVQTSDRAALSAPVWGALRVSRVMDKASFLDWFEEQAGALWEREGHPHSA
jgi:CheY-like chemotaxis protein